MTVYAEKNSQSSWNTARSVAADTSSIIYRFRVNISVYLTDSIPVLKFRKLLWRFRMNEDFKINFPEITSEILSGGGGWAACLWVCVCEKFGRPAQGRSWELSTLFSWWQGRRKYNKIIFQGQFLLERPMRILYMRPAVLSTVCDTDVQKPGTLSEATLLIMLSLKIN